MVTANNARGIFRILGNVWTNVNWRQFLPNRHWSFIDFQNCVKYLSKFCVVKMQIKYNWCNLKHYFRLNSRNIWLLEKNSKSEGLRERRIMFKFVSFLVVFYSNAWCKVLSSNSDLTDDETLLDEELSGDYDGAEGSGQPMPVSFFYVWVFEFLCT